MYPRVTAIVVAHSGGHHLQRTLDALAAQTRKPDAVIAVDCAATDDAPRLLAESGPTQLVSVQEKLPFGAAVATALRVTAPPSSDNEWLWLLAQDTAPEPGALEALLAAVEVSPSVAAAGPKLVDWEDPAFIRELGEAMTPFGAAVPLVENEMDQAQHDGLSDVLAVSSAGMIVRHTLWDQLGGFDPGLPTADDGLDFSTRVRLAGFRVTLVAAARVAIAGDGVAGPNLSRKWRVRRRLVRERRAAQLHRRMVYAPGAAVPFHWLSLVPLAILRSIGRIVRKEPGAVGGELAAAFAVAFSGMRIGNARRALATSKSVSWAAIAPLRIPFPEVRRARALKREAAMVGQQGERQELDFFGTGGGWTVLVALVVGIAVFFPLLGSSAVSGGGLLPLNSSVGQLWANLGYGWRDLGLGFVGAADPLSAVLAVLGTLTFWNPSFSLVVLYVAALPLAALGAWLAAARLTNRTLLRAFAGLTYAIAPTLLVGLQDGRPAAVLAHVLLPWLFFAGLVARRSWAASAVTALLAAATLACAPALIPGLLVAWIAAIAFAGRRAARIVFIPLPAVVLFAPLVWQQAGRGAWLSIFADPGVVQNSRQTPAWQLALGFPDGTLGGWHTLAAALDIPAAAPNILVPILLAPLGVLAILALFLRGSSRAVAALVVALLGFLSAVAALHLQVASMGATVVPIWPGTAVSLYWLGLVGAAVLALSAVGRAAVYPAWVALIAVAVAVVPSAVGQYIPDQSAVSASSGSRMPAVVTAKAATQPRVGTLRITPEPGGGIATDLVRGAGETLDEQSTLSSTERTLTARQQALAALGGNLASASGYDATQRMKTLGVDFVLLTPPATTLDPQKTGSEHPTEIAKTTGSRAATALDANPILVPVGTTPNGQLWAFDRGTSAVAPAAQIPADAGGTWRTIVLVVQAVVIALTLLMSLPTIRSADRVAELNARRPKRRAVREDDVAVEPEDEPEDDESIGDESLSEYEAEPDDEAAVESAGDDEVAQAASDGNRAETTDEPDGVAADDDLREAAEPRGADEVEAADPREPDDVEPARETVPPTPAAWTPAAPTTLEDGLDETVIRPRRTPEGGTRG